MKKDQIENIVESRETKAGLYFDYVIQALIFLSIISFSVETIPDLSDQTKEFLNLVELVCIVIFSIEYLIRIYLAKSKLKFIFSFFGLIDLIAILPFYLSFGFDLRSARVLRFLRVFRLLKLARYNKAIQRFIVAFRLIREELIMFGAVALVLIYLSAVGIYYFENSAQPEQFSSIFSSLWWSVVTLTTVGYGDISPVSPIARLLAYLQAVVGQLYVAILVAGLVGAYMSKKE